MRYKLELMSLDSRRGKYTPAILEENPLIWTPGNIDTVDNRYHMVIEEIRYAKEGRLHEHPYWDNEPEYWVFQYQSFYNDLFSLRWLYDNADRHSILINGQCCLTLVQYHNHRLIAYSRSTDMRNGYFSDKLVLEYLAQHINTWRPDCKVKSIEWYLAVPHVYNEKGIARLLERKIDT